MILAGGEGKRLGPLTLDRAKPAVPFGGRYRIIDIVLSNFVNSGLCRASRCSRSTRARRSRSTSRAAWRLSPMLDNFIETIPAQQRTGKSWFKGSADAVYQTQHVITDETPEHVCIFGGDHVYKMDVRQMIDAHLARDADVTVAAIPVPREEARDFGVIECDDERPHHRLPREGRRTRRRCPATPTWPRLDGQLHLQDRARSSTSSSATRRARASNHDFGRDILPRGRARAGASSSTTSRPTSSSRT